MSKDLKELEGKIGYKFDDFTLFTKAMIHSSYANEKHLPKYECNERLEFLGDAVLEVVSSDFLFKNFPDMAEGQMSKKRASLVCEPTLAMDAREIDLEDFIYLGKGEDETGGRKRDSIVSDAFEALIGAIFLDGGIEEAKYFILKFALNDIEKKKLFYDSKTVLQERVNSVKNGNLVYEIIKEWGPDHNKTYEAAAKLNGKIIGKGQGHTKKAAEQQAAFDALKTLDKRN